MVGKDGDARGGVSVSFDSLSCIDGVAAAAAAAAAGSLLLCRLLVCSFSV